MSTLRTKMEQDLAARSISPRTGHSYLRFVAGLTRHYRRAPDTLAIGEVEAYLVHLRQVRQLTPRASGPSARSYASSTTQVPFWLVYGREAVVATGGRAAWRQLLSTLVGAGRRVYWIQNRLASPPTSSDLAFTPTGTDIDVAILLPDAPADTPPTLAVRKLVPIRVYRVAAGDR